MICCLWFVGICARHEKMYDLLPVICWYLCEAWKDVRFVAYDLLVSEWDMKRCTICCLWFAGICARHEKMYDLLPMICWYLCEAWKDVRFVAYDLLVSVRGMYDLLPMICWYLCEAWKDLRFLVYDLLVSVRGMKRCKICCLWFAGICARHEKMYDLLPMICWYLCEAWKDVRFVAYDLLVSVRGMKRCMICCLWFAGICARHEKMYDLLPMICWYLCEAWKDVRFVAYDLLVSKRGMKRCTICCLWFAGICARHEKMDDLLPMICWYLCEAWKDVRFVAYDLLVSVRGMKRCTICCLWFAGICARHEKMDDLLPMICWYLCEAWKDARFVAYDLLVSVRGMKRWTICCLWFAGICARHEKMYDLLPMICWYLCEAWKDVRFVTYDLLVSLRSMKRCTICCLWFAGICARHEKMYDLLPMICWYLCEAWKDTRFVAFDLLESVRGMKRCTICCLWFAGICARHEKMYDLLPVISWYLCEAWKDIWFVAYDLLVSVRGMKRCTICCLWFAGICARHEKMYDLLPMICWYLCETWKDERFVAYDLLVSVRGMKRCTICCLWFAGICARHEKMNDLLVSVRGMKRYTIYCLWFAGICARHEMIYDFLPMICWYLCEAWKDIRFVACDLLVSVRCMKRCTICCLWFAGICARHEKMNDLLPMICWYLCEAWKDERFVAYDLLVSVRGMKRCTICCLWFAGICARHEKMYDLLPMICWYLCEAWKNERFVTYDLLVSLRSMKRCTICCLWFAGICARHEKMYDLLPMICWYLCEAWKDVRFVAYDLLVSVRGMKRCTICCLWFAGICARHEKMYDLLPMICWYHCEAWEHVRFVAYDLLVSVRDMKRWTICCLWFAGICARHEKIHDLLPMICWYPCEAWKDVRFVAYDLLVSVRGMKRCTICCLWFAGICARHEKMNDLLPMICWYLCEAWKDERFFAYDLLVSVRGMKRCTICCLWFAGIWVRHEKMYDLLPMICWYLCEAWKDVRFVAYDLLVSVRGMKRCTICCLWFTGICTTHEKMYDLLPMICWYLCEAWKDIRFVAYDLLVSVRGMKRCTICCLWFAGICARHEKIYDLLPMICWYLCEAWKDVRFVAYDLLVSVRGMKRCMICCLWFAGICARHEKMYDLLPMICWYLCEAWKDVRFVAYDLLVSKRGMKRYDLLVSVRGMKRCTICCLWFAGICARHEKIYDLLPMICWYLCEAWKDIRFVAYDLLVSVRGMKRCTICCLWFAGICARHEKMNDFLPMICWYLCEAWKDVRFVAYNLLVSLRGMKTCTICCLWFAGICARHEKMYDLLPMICWYLCEAWKDVRFVAYDLLVSVRGMKRCTICCLWFADICARHEKMYDLLPMICWYLCEAWKDVRFVADDLLVSVRGMKRWTICCYLLLASVRGMKICTICCLWFAGICARHEKMYDLLPMICWYLCEAWKDARFVAYDLLVSVRGMKRCTICCLWFAGICARHEKMYDLLPMICWYLCEAWKDVRFVAYDLLVSVRGMKRCTICCLWFAGICARHEKMNDLLSMICWYLCEAWKDVWFVAYDLLVSMRGMKRCTICCPWFAGICARHEKMNDFLPMICWYLCEAWKDLRFVAYDLLVSVRGMKRCTICCLWFAGIWASHEKMYDLLPMICWYLCEAWKDERFAAYDLLVSVRGMKRWTICCLWFAGICARHEKMDDSWPII